MRRIVAALGVGLLATVLTAGVAGATESGAKNPARTTTAAVKSEARHWYAVAGTRRTETAAKELMAKLEAKRFDGFEPRTREIRHAGHHVRRVEVERMYPNRRAAKAEAKRLREAGFKGRIAHERG